MRKRGTVIFFLINFVFLLTNFSAATPQGGAIKGTITDVEGFPLPGAYVYINSPVMMQVETYITSDTGKFKFRGLPPGKYTLRVDMPGFKSVKISNIIINAGKTTPISIILEMTTLEEEISIKIPSPTLDVESTKFAIPMDSDMLEQIPFSKDLYKVISSAPGVITEPGAYFQYASFKGASVRANTYVFDGLVMNDPVGGQLLTHINFDVLEEVEIVSSAHPAEFANPGGSYINILSKSVSNRFGGAISIYGTNKSLSSPLRSDKELDDMNVSPPSVYKTYWDFSLSLGGAIMKDRIRFFGNTRYLVDNRTTPFIPWTDPQGNKHSSYNWKKNEFMGFFKLDTQVTDDIHIIGMFHFNSLRRPGHEFFPDWNLTQEAVQNLNREKIFSLSGSLNYTMGQNTFVDVKAGYLYDDYPLSMPSELLSLPEYQDVFTGHLWGSAKANDDRFIKRFQGQGNITHFYGRILGFDHELKAGGEYDFSTEGFNPWKENNLIVKYFSQDPYYYGEALSPATENTVGKGLVAFPLVGSARSKYPARIEVKRMGFFIQDTVNFTGRMTLNLGLRFDRSIGQTLPHIKAESGNPVAVKIGEEQILPLIDVNPYAEIEAPIWENILAWNTISPRFGLSFDVLGNGKTLFKASFASYPEIMMLDYLFPLYPFGYPRSHNFYWYDENMDRIPDVNDTYELFPEDYRIYQQDYYKMRVDPDIKSPYTDEVTVSLSHELFSDLSIGVNYIMKDKSNIIEDVLYSPDEDRDWYTTELDTEGWWIPFYTIVPETDKNPVTPLTVYFLSKDAPPLFTRLKNVPELKKKYQALEFFIHKRMSRNWMFSGSIVFSKSTGNIGIGYGMTSGFSSSANTPNDFINLTESSVLDLDRPFMLNFMGTYIFPYNIHLSLYFSHKSGLPWLRTVQVMPPAEWAQENNAFMEGVSVLLEEPGKQRLPSLSNLDIRLEKEFQFRNNRKLGIYMDVLNLLGNKYRQDNPNDGGYWYPSDENSSEGIRLLSPVYNTTTTLYGSRIFLLGVRLNF